MRSPKEYKESLKRMRPNVYKFGELIEDVTTHPATRRTVEGHAKLFWAAMSERWGELFSKESSLIGERVSRYLTLIKTPEDMVANCRMKRAAFNLTGTCTGGRCVGWNAINAMWATAYEMARDGVEWGEEYSRRLMEWLIWAQKEDITLSGALTDPKGDRTKGPGGQKDPLSYLKIVEKDDEGITVRGAKIMIAGVAAANYIFVLPGRGMREG
ncbi:MAG: 4-hydroxyphenylacetate 3-hydroxylase, partial [Thermoplasmata archaeon]|nr:4-hydroxyphenylacetate 3-hydroxylase [Thermoplasmata archaeon]